MLSQEEMDKVVLEAKKSMTVEQMKDAIQKCSCGGPITSKSEYKRMVIQKGGDMINGKTNV